MGPSQSRAQPCRACPSRRARLRCSKTQQQPPRRRQQQRPHQHRHRDRPQQPRVQARLQPLRSARVQLRRLPRNRRPRDRLLSGCRMHSRPPRSVRSTLEPPSSGLASVARRSTPARGRTSGRSRTIRALTLVSTKREVPATPTAFLARSKTSPIVHTAGPAGLSRSGMIGIGVARGSVEQTIGAHPRRRTQLLGPRQSRAQPHIGL